MLATAALTRRAVQTRSCKAAALTVRTCIVLSCFALLYAAHAAHMAASRYEQKVSATLQQILEAQARAAADTAESEWHRAKAAEDAAAEARDEAEADTDAAAAESDRAEEVEDNAKAATDETNADKEEAEAETESKKVAADETAADSEQAGATAEGAKASEEEAEAEADEAAEVVLSVVPGVDVVADTAGTAVAGGLQATAAADTAEAAELEGESMSEWAAKLEAEAELGQTRAAEAAVGNRAIRNRAAAKEAEEEAEAEEADEESERAHKAKTEEDAAKQKAKAAQEKADAEQARAHAVCKFVDLIDFSIEAILFALLSLAFAVLPALFLLGKWVASACRFGGWLVLRPCQTLAAGGSRQFVECLHGLTLALMAFRFLLPVVAAAVRKLGHDELRLGNFKDTHKSAAIMLHNFEILAPTIKQAVGSFVARSFVVFLWTLIVEFAFMLERLRCTSMPFSRRFCRACQGSADMACMAGLVSAAGSVVVLSWSRSLWELLGDALAFSSISFALELCAIFSLIAEACCRWQWAPPPQEMLEQQETGQPQRESRGIWVCLADAALTLLEGTISVVEGAMTIGAGWMLSSLLMFALCVCELAVPYALPRAKTFVAHWWFWLMYSIVVLVLADVAYVVIHLRPWCRRGDLKGVQEALLPQ